MTMPSHVFASTLTPLQAVGGRSSPSTAVRPRLVRRAGLGPPPPGLEVRPRTWSRRPAPGSSRPTADDRAELGVGDPRHAKGSRAADGGPVLRIIDAGRPDRAEVRGRGGHVVGQPRGAGQVGRAPPAKIAAGELAGQGHGRVRPRDRPDPHVQRGRSDGRVDRRCPSPRRGAAPHAKPYSAGRRRVHRVTGAARCCSPTWPRSPAVRGPQHARRCRTTVE